MNYKIIYRKSAVKELEDLPDNEIPKVKSAIDALAGTPRPDGVKKLTGIKESLWRLRVGNYRIIYSIEDVIKVVEIRTIGDRKDIYK